MFRNRSELGIFTWANIVYKPALSRFNSSVRHIDPTLKYDDLPRRFSLFKIFLLFVFLFLIFCFQFFWFLFFLFCFYFSVLPIDCLYDEPSKHLTIRVKSSIFLTIPLSFLLLYFFRCLANRLSLRRVVSMPDDSNQIVDISHHPLILVAVFFSKCLANRLSVRRVQRQQQKAKRQRKVPSFISLNLTSFYTMIERRKVPKALSNVELYMCRI